MGVGSTDGISREEIYAYVDLLKREDGGKAFLQIMRHFDHSPQYKARYYRAVQHVSYPVQAIWGADDSGLTYERYGKEIREVAGLPGVHQTNGKHLLQEDNWAFVAGRVAALAVSPAAR